MKTVCFYISDYGTGHAARAVALIRAIVQHDESVRIIAKTAGPIEFVKRSLVHPRVSVVECRNDPEIIHIRGQATVDRAETRQAFLLWMRSWDVYVARERAFCLDNDIDLILSDIAPQPFEVAEALDIPSLAISNFAWDTIYGHLFPDLEDVVRLTDAYRSASFACILPFEIGMQIFPHSERVGLVSRPMSVSRQEMRRRLGIADDDFLVFIGPSPELISLSSSDMAVPRAHSQPTGPASPSTVGGNSTVRFLVPSGVSLHGALAIPAAETESQNWIGMCDCVVAKCGYSTISEAVRARIPLLVWKRDGFIEDEAIARRIESFGIGQTVSGALDGIDRCRGGYISVRAFKENYDTLENQYSTDGISEVLRVVEEMMQ
jgi:hypothetical protein